MADTMHRLVAYNLTGNQTQSVFLLEVEDFTREIVADDQGKIQPDESVLFSVRYLHPGGFATQIFQLERTFYFSFDYLYACNCTVISLALR